MDFNLLIRGVFDGLIQIYKDVVIGLVHVDYFLPEWNIVIYQDNRPIPLRYKNIIKNKIVETHGDDFPVVFMRVIPGKELHVINSILRIASHDLYWYPGGYVDHGDWIDGLGDKQ